MARHGFDRHELAAVAAELGDLRVEGFAVHLPWAMPGQGAATSPRRSRGRPPWKRRRSRPTPCTSRTSPPGADGARRAAATAHRQAAHRHGAVARRPGRVRRALDRARPAPRLTRRARGLPAAADAARGLPARARRRHQPRPRPGGATRHRLRTAARQDARQGRSRGGRVRAEPVLRRRQAALVRRAAAHAGQPGVPARRRPARPRWATPCPSPCATRPRRSTRSRSTEARRSTADHAVPVAAAAGVVAASGRYHQPSVPPSVSLPPGSLPPLLLPPPSLPPPLLPPEPLPSRCRCRPSRRRCRSSSSPSWASARTSTPRVLRMLPGRNELTAVGGVDDRVHVGLERHRREGAAVERDQVALEVLVADAAVVHHGGRELGGVRRRTTTTTRAGSRRCRPSPCRSCRRSGTASGRDCRCRPRRS